MELDEYERMAEVEATHWWYRSSRALLQQLLADHLPARLQLQLHKFIWHPSTRGV